MQVCVDRLLSISFLSLEFSELKHLYFHQTYNYPYNQITESKNEVQHKIYLWTHIYKIGKFVPSFVC